MSDKTLREVPLGPEGLDFTIDGNQLYVWYKNQLVAYRLNSADHGFLNKAAVENLDE